MSERVTREKYNIVGNQLLAANQLIAKFRKELKETKESREEYCRLSLELDKKNSKLKAEIKALWRKINER